MGEILQYGILLFTGFFAIVMLLCGAVVVALGFFALQRHRAVTDWPRTAALIESSDVVAERHFEDQQMYRPKISYRYSAPGGSYPGDKIAITGRLFAREEQARRAIAPYPAGATVIARYNPADPSEAILQRDGAGGVGFVLFGLLCWVMPVIAARQAGLSWLLIASVLTLLATLPLLAMLTSRSRLAVARSRGLCPPAGSCSDTDVARLATHGEKMLAILLYRELHGGGLKDARLAVEALIRAQTP